MTTWRNRIVVSAVLILLSCVRLTQGQTIEKWTISYFESRVTSTMKQARMYHVRSANLRYESNSGGQKQQLYDNLAKQLMAPAELAHLPFPAQDPEREWTVNALKVARGIKPNTQYLVSCGKKSTVIAGTKAATENAYNNVRLIAWYRDQLEQDFSDGATNIGARALARLIDEFLVTLSDSLPEIKIKRYGRMNDPRDHRIEFRESKLWGILSSINRYFFYKIQVNSGQKDFYAADFLLMNSLIQTAALYGAKPQAISLNKFEVPVSRTATGWQGAAFDAIHSWEQEINGEHRYPQQLCCIKIPPKNPPKPAKKPAPPKKPNAFPAGVEDVKEIGGQTFLKIKGHWMPWDKKT